MTQWVKFDAPLGLGREDGNFEESLERLLALAEKRIQESGDDL